MKKRLLPLCLVLLLCGCGAASNTEQPREETPASDAEETTYFFANGQLLGGEQAGEWVSATSEEHSMTVAELLSPEIYYGYRQNGTVSPLLQMEFTTGTGLGGFPETSPSAAELLAPYAATVERPEEFPTAVFPTGTVLEGEAAKLLVPDYAFYVTFGGQTLPLVSSRQLPTEQTFYNMEYDYVTYDPTEDYAMLADYLKELGVLGGYEVSIHLVQGDTGDTVYITVNSARDEMGYWVDDESTQLYAGLVLCKRPDGTIETVYQKLVPYETYQNNTTELFAIETSFLQDLNGDGQEEAILQYHGWEWGHTFVIERQEDGTWETVLQANSGT